MFIRVNGPSLNKNISKYHLPHMWDEVLNNSRELKTKIIDSVVIPSTTRQITSAHIPTKWLYHLPQGNNISPSNKSGHSIHHIWQKHQPSYFGNNISHHIGNNISQHMTISKVVITSATKAIRSALHNSNCFSVKT